MDKTIFYPENESKLENMSSKNFSGRVETGRKFLFGRPGWVRVGEITRRSGPGRIDIYFVVGGPGPGREFF
jgi:hypothetical protein